MCGHILLGFVLYDTIGLVLMLYNLKVNLKFICDFAHHRYYAVLNFAILLTCSIVRYQTKNIICIAQFFM